MYPISQVEAASAIALHANKLTLTAAQIQAALGNASITFAQISYVTKVLTAAAHKAELLQKVTCANVILCANIAAQTSVYANRVRKTATALGQSNDAAIAAFAPQANYFSHTACYSVVQHNEHPGKLYLYAIYNGAESAYMHNGVLVDKAHVMQYLTASAAKQLANTSGVVHNKTHDVYHSVQVRTIALDNLVQIVVRKQLLSV